LDPVQRWYRILSEALKRYLKGRQLDPPLRIAPARAARRGCERLQIQLPIRGQLPDLGFLRLSWDAPALMGGQGFGELVANGSIKGRLRRSRLLQAGSIRGIPSFAIPHPSSAWRHPPVTDQDWAQIAAGIGAIRR
jgi:hypothetical protein